ncbi:MAG: DUF4381 domain-containing protein [Porticoccaceae bacterium]
MNTSDPLAQLRDIHLPEAVSWWPLAPGWWILGAALVAGIIYLSYFFWQRYQLLTYRRQALLDIKQLPNNSQHDRITALLALLKRVAASAYPELNLSSYNQAEFIAFLKQTCPKAGFEQLPTDWENLFYAKHAEVPAKLVDQLLSSGIHWIKHHPLTVNLKDIAHA